MEHMASIGIPVAKGYRQLFSHPSTTKIQTPREEQTKDKRKNEPCIFFQT